HSLWQSCLSYCIGHAEAIGSAAMDSGQQFLWEQAAGHRLQEFQRGFSLLPAEREGIENNCAANGDYRRELPQDEMISWQHQNWTSGPQSGKCRGTRLQLMGFGFIRRTLMKGGLVKCNPSNGLYRKDMQVNARATLHGARVFEQ